MRPRNVRLFVKTYCSWCDEAADWLDRHRVSYETLDVSTDSAAMKEMIAISDQRRAPVIEVDGEVLADFGASELEIWWKEKGFAPS